ncbi:MAG TPA: serine/threonine-protein kinase [Polyangia bacterium]|nr:serine/threonine-protein kinase [Polyangia bacterium]
MIGEALGNYKITAKIGGGTMGVVFRADHTRIARTAAIKVLIPELAQNASAVQRFFTEARATSLIRHPGIVDVFDCDVDAAGRAYIVMEHLEGETLAERLRRSASIPWAAACEIARQVAAAIGSAHDRGIVHRDLKPENVFLVRDPAAPDTVAAVKVLDFGIAKLLTPDASARLTMRGMVLGTPEYMAPEQCEGSGDIDERADIYALGCILFEMLSGDAPFVADAAQELMLAHMFHPVPSIGERMPGLPAWLAGLVTIMLAKRRDERPASMHEVARALGERAKATQLAQAPAMRRGVRAAPVVVAIVGISALGLAVWRGGRPSRRPPHAETAAIVAPARAAAPAPPASVAPAAVPVVQGTPPAPPVRKRARPPEQPRRPAAPGAPAAKHAVDIDGIVDL